MKLHKGHPIKIQPVIPEKITVSPIMTPEEVKMEIEERYSQFMKRNFPHFYRKE